MKVEEIANVKEILWEVLDLDPAKRREFMDNAGVVAEIRAEIESLLAFEAVSEDFMSVPITDFTKDFVSESEDSEISIVGQEIGIYKVIGELGFGGMGSVYLAERTDGKFSQRVAIKLLKREFNVKKIRQTFEREKEILSKLNHPNIASLLDAGTTADGIPYLVMEFIEGLPIDKFCSIKNLPLNLRLKLFNKVCDAVSYAHRNLIVHRDLKPSNILVTEKGEPMLLDFGISKLLDENGEEESFVTAFGAMTPEYAAPEQIKGETVSTATDIYSLGVVLYKILTDAHPFELKGKTNGELLKAITDEQPLAPSAVSKLRFQSSKVENQIDRISNIADRKSLRGDLDTIILKSLSKEPERRYKTVEHFSGDIWRHLDGLPVAARPPTFGYRAGKFIHRNTISVVAVLLIFLSLIMGIAAALWQAREARAQAQFAIESQRRSEIETEKAKEEQRKAEKVTKFISKIFGYANPGWFAEGAKSGGKARVIDVVEELSDKIDVEFAGEADVAANLHGQFASIFHWVGKKANGDRLEELRQRRAFHALRALELRRQFYGEHHELVAESLYGAYAVVGKTDEERARVLGNAIQMMRDTNAQNINLPYMFEAYVARLMLPEYEALHDAYRNAVSPPTDENKYQIAERYLREAIPVWHLHYPPEHGVIIAKECWLSYALARQEKWTDFEEHYTICKQGAGTFKAGNSIDELTKDLGLK